jgi:hypothetical protein
MIAFLFTTKANFGSSPGTPPDINTGGTILPPSIGDATLGSRHAFALIYSFKKRDLGNPTPFREVSALQHLDASGVIAELKRR